MASAGAVRRTLPGRFRRFTGTPGLGCSGFRAWSSLDRCYREVMSIGACDSPFRPVTGLLSVPIAGSSQWARGSSSRLAGKSHFRAVGWGRCRHRAAVRGRKQGRAGSNACKSRAGGDSFARGFACAMSMGLYSTEPTARRSATSVGCDSYTAKRAAYLSISIPCWRLTGSRRARASPVQTAKSCGDPPCRSSNSAGCATLESCGCDCRRARCRRRGPPPSA